MKIPIFKSLIKIFFFIVCILLSINALADTIKDTNKAGNADSVIIITADSLIVKQAQQTQQQENVNEEKIDPASLLKFFSFAKIVWSLIILVVTYFIIRVISKVLSIWAELSTKQRVAIKGIIPVIRILFWIGSLSFILVSVIRPPMATMLAFAASIGVAIGFASQDLLKNIFGGISIIVDRPFKTGDKVKFGEYYGEVKAIGLRSTRLITPDDSLVSVPNAEIMNQSVANSNAGEDNCQVVTEFFLPINIDIEQIKPFAYEAASV